MIRFAAVSTVFLFIFFGFVCGGTAAENASVGKMIEEYHEVLEEYAGSLTSQKWGEVKKNAQSLLKESEEIDNLGKKEKNKVWMKESALLVTHSKELIKLAEEKEGVESFFVAAGLYMHLQLFKATNPALLLDSIDENIKQLTEAIEEKDVKEAIEAAEKINMGASAMALSGMTAKKKFANTRWIDDANEMSMEADEIQEPMHDGQWSKTEEPLKKIAKIQRKIQNSLKK